MSVTAGEFRRALGCFAAGVTVVTTRQPNGLPCGLTATAFTSVSVDPPLVLVCVDRRSESYPHFATSGVFAVNILTAAQEGVSARFAVSGGDKFAGVSFRWGLTGAPILTEHLAYLECRMVREYEGGDHTIYVGEVLEAGVADGRPLLYYRGVYATLADSRNPVDEPTSSGG
jgi:flavin reductase (DIM6/NTAB) family NADH-FMN oxidoreductase RutF